MTHDHGVHEWNGTAWNERQTALSKHLREVACELRRKNERHLAHWNVQWWHRQHH